MKLKLNNQGVTKILAASLAASALFTAACGSRTKDPLQNYDSLRASVPAYTRQTATQTTQTPLFTIENQDSLNFYQGEDTKVNFKVRLFFADNSSVRYKLHMLKAPAGATLDQVGPDSFSMHWHPTTNLLSPNEDKRNFDVQLSFDLEPSSSPVSFANMAGYYNKKDLVVTLYKEQDQPVIEQSEKNPIKLIPGGEVNADQDVKIQFVAAAKGLHKPQDLKINFDRGPQEPSIELAQMDGYFATDLHATQGRSLGVDEQGRARYEYTINFRSRAFADELQKRIDATPRLKTEFQTGELTAGEALFYISAYNEYNQRTSIQREIVIKVNMKDKAGEPKFVGEAGSLVAKVGTQTSEQFFIKADGARGDVIINSIRLNAADKAVEATKKSAALTISQDGVDLTLNCQPSGPALGEIMGCKTGSCVKSCRIQLSSTCDAKEGATNLIIGTEANLGASKQQKDLTFRVELKGKAAGCVAAAKASGGQKP